MKCDRNCFDCKFEDCIVNDVSETEREMQAYRDQCAIVTGKPLPKSNRRNKRKQSKGRFY